MSQVITFLESPLGLFILGAIYLAVMHLITKKKPELAAAWKTWEGHIITGIQVAEKLNIPGTEKAKKVLDDLVAVKTAADGIPPDATWQDEIKQGISILHAQLEASGNLDDKAVTK